MSYLLFPGGYLLFSAKGTYHTSLVQRPRIGI